MGADELQAIGHRVAYHDNEVPVFAIHDRQLPSGRPFVECEEPNLFVVVT
jgi:hypothetical protein